LETGSERTAETWRKDQNEQQKSWVKFRKNSRNLHGEKIRKNSKKPGEKTWKNSKNLEKRSGRTAEDKKIRKNSMQKPWVKIRKDSKNLERRSERTAVTWRKDQKEQQKMKRSERTVETWKKYQKEHQTELSFYPCMKKKYEAKKNKIIL
jgi:hypothetical protein